MFRPSVSVLSTEPKFAYICIVFVLNIQTILHDCILLYRCLRKENTPPDKSYGLSISSESTKSEAGLQFLPLGRMAKAQVNKRSVSFKDTGISIPVPLVSGLSVARQHTNK